LIVFTVSDSDSISFNSRFFLGKIFKRNTLNSSVHGGRRTTASIEACGASDGGSICGKQMCLSRASPPDCPIFSFFDVFRFCNDNFNKQIKNGVI